MKSKQNVLWVLNPGCEKKLIYLIINVCYLRLYVCRFSIVFNPVRPVAVYSLFDGYLTVGGENFNKYSLVDIGPKWA